MEQSASEIPLSLPRPAPRRLRFVLVAVVLSALSVAIYLLASAYIFRIGFPLDDAWIHQTYARNVGQRGEWAFIPGQPSAGSTAPLWSGLLAIGHLLRLGPYVWTHFLGWTLLAALSLITAWAFKVYTFKRAGWAPWIGMIMIFEWHLVWASASGMETLLFAILALGALAWLAAGWRRWLGLGLLIGLSAWVRPDGITLLGPAIVVVALSKPAGWEKRRAFLELGLGFLALFGPYLLFNRLMAGSWWPNTFYAKQAEYAALLGIPLVKRYLDQANPLMQGVGAVLLPGFLFFVCSAFRRRAWGALAGAAWLVGDLGLYAWRLPAAYQHGRYLIPVLPVYLILGAAGLAEWLQPGSPVLWRRVVSRAWMASTGLVLAIYWVMGAFAYAGDVAFIESEMVSTALWVAENTETDALLAAHDIGALGYFGGRSLLDLAGLVSPQVIPFIRDDAQLKKFLDEEKADYLVTFPGWYPDLVNGAVPVFDTQGIFSPRSGGENMAVYPWK